MLVFGIDTGSHKCGYAVLVVDRLQLQYLACGVISAPANDTKWERIHGIANDVRDVLVEHGAAEGDMLAIESAYVPRGRTMGVETLAEARGAIVYVALEAGIKSLRTVAPATVKKLVTGHGRAEKQGVAEALRVLFRLNKVPAPDAADALGVAVAAARGAGK